MATPLYLRDKASSGIGTYRDAVTTAGSGATTGVVATNGSTEKQWEKTDGGVLLEWITGRSPAGGWTLAGTVSFSIWAHESATSANAGARARLFKRTAAGSESEVTGGPFDDGVEFTKTTPTEMTWTGSPSSTAFAENDRLVIRIYITNVGSMGTGQTCTLTYDAAEASTGDSQVTLTETVAFKAEVIERTPTPSAIAVAEFRKGVVNPLVARPTQSVAVSENVQPRLLSALVRSLSETVSGYDGQAGEQQQTNTGDRATFNNTTWLAQTFTPAESITCCSFLLRLKNTLGAGYPLVVSVRATDGDGKPTGSDLAASAAKNVTASFDSQWEAALARPLLLSAGTKYAIVVRSTGTDSFLSWYYASGTDPYANGEYLSSSNSGSTWTATATNDFQFLIRGKSIALSFAATRLKVDAEALAEAYTTGPFLTTGQLGNTWWKGQTFKAVTSHRVVKLGVKIARFSAGTLPGTITISIRATTGSPAVPTGADLGSGTTDGDTLPAGAGNATWREVEIAPAVAVSADETYAIVVAAPGAATTFAVYWAEDYVAGGGYADGSEVVTSDSGENWNADTGGDFAFEVYRDNALEVSTAAESVTPSVAGTAVLSADESEVLTVSDVSQAVVSPLAVHAASEISASDVVTGADLFTGALTQAAAEAIAASDEAAVLLGLGTRPAETGTAADVLGNAVLSPLAVHAADAATTADVAGAAAHLGRRPLETISVAENRKPVVSPLASHRSDAITVTDAATTGGDLLLVRSEAVTAADAAQAVVTPDAVHAAETLTATDSAKAALQLGQRPAEALSAADAATVAVQLGLRLAEALAALDNLKAVAAPLAVHASDSASATDASDEQTAGAGALARSVAQAISAADSVHSAIPVISTAVSEAISALDNAAKSTAQAEVGSQAILAVVELDGTNAEAWVGSQAILIVLELFPDASVSDAIAIADAVTAALAAGPVSRSATDSITVSEFLKGVPTPLAVHAAEAITTADAVTAGGQRTANVADTVAVSEFLKAVRSPLAVHAAEAVTATDAAAANMPLGRAVSVAIAVTEFAKAIRTLGKVLSEAATVSDSADPQTISVGALARSVNDQIQVTDFVKAARSLTASREELIAVTDTASASVSPLVALLSEAIAVAEVIRQASELRLDLAETAAVLDAVFANLSIPAVEPIGASVFEAISAISKIRLGITSDRPISVTDNATALVAFDYEAHGRRRIFETPAEASASGSRIFETPAEAEAAGSRIFGTASSGTPRIFEE